MNGLAWLAKRSIPSFGFGLIYSWNNQRPLEFQWQHL